MRSGSFDYTQQLKVVVVLQQTPHTTHKFTKIKVLGNLTIKINEYRRQDIQFILNDIKVTIWTLAYKSHMSDQYCFALSEVTADRHELMIAYYAAVHCQYQRSLDPRHIWQHTTSPSNHIRPSSISPH